MKLAPGSALVPLLVGLLSCGPKDRAPVNRSSVPTAGSPSGDCPNFLAPLNLSSAPMLVPANDVISVRDWGAVGDGRADDTEALARAAQAAGKSGKILYVPAGIYLLSRPLELPVPSHPTAHFTLASPGATLRAAVPMQSVLTSQRTFKLMLDGIQIDANHKAQHGLYLNHVGGSTSVIRHVQVTSAVSHGMLIQEGQAITIQNSASTTNGGDAMRFEGCNGSLVVASAAVNSQGNGITVKGLGIFSGGMTIDSTDVEANKGHGIVVDGTSSPVVVRSCWIEGNQLDGVRIQAPSVVVTQTQVLGFSMGDSWAIHLTKEAKGATIFNNYLQDGKGDPSYASVRSDQEAGPSVVEPNFMRRIGLRLRPISGPPALLPGLRLVLADSTALMRQGFEESPTLWDKYAEPQVLELSRAKAHQGSVSLHLVSGQKVSGATTPIEKLVQKGQRYRATAWLYVAKGRAELAVHNGFGLVQGIANTNEAAWVQRQIDFVVYDRGAWVGVIAEPNSEVFIDDIELSALRPESSSQAGPSSSVR